jgi:hypothetical protein
MLRHAISSTAATPHRDPPWHGLASDDVPHQVGNPTLEHPLLIQWFNASAFAIRAPFTFGSLGRNSLRAGWFRSLYCCLFRVFPISGKVVFAPPGDVTNNPQFWRGEFYG